jgi:hypothetical protein
VFLALILLSGFAFYAIDQNITQQYNATVSSMGANDQNRSKENIVINQITITSNYTLNVTATNDGPTQSQLIWLGIFNNTANPTNPENQTYQKLNNVFVGPGQTVNIVSNVTVTSGNQYLIQLVTELGNTVDCNFYSANYVSCALTLVTAPPTVYQGNNVTVLLTVTANNTLVNSIQSLTATINATPTGLVQLMSNSSLSVTGLTQGTSAFFWWVYNAVSTGTVSFNASYLQAPTGTYALSTAQIISPPQQGAQGSVTITGVNCTDCQNPWQWTPLGSTQNSSVPASYLASNDSSYAVFGSYYTGSTVSNNIPVSNSVSNNVDNSSIVGTQSNFTAMQSGPNSIYDNLTEGGTTDSFWQENISGYQTDTQNDYSGYEWFSDWTTNSTSSGTVTTIGIYIFTNPGNSVQVKLGIYNDSGGNPNALIAYTNAATIPASAPQWLDLAIVSPQGGLNITPSTTYHVAEITNSSPTYDWREEKLPGSGQKTSQYSTGINWPTLPNPAGSVTSATTYRHGAYMVDYQGYSLNLEVQWTGLNTNQQNASLCIYGGTMAAENLLVDVWNSTGLSWQNVFNPLNTGWNNQSVISYLTSSNFTIRFRDQNPGGIVQNSWQVGYCLLQLSNTTNQYTAQVAFTNYGDMQNWTQIVWFVDTSCNTSLVNMTAQLYNYALGSYSSSGNGYVAYISNSTNSDTSPPPQTITANPTNFRNSTGYWNVEITGVASTQFQMNVNWIELRDSYAYVSDSIPYKSLVWYTIQATTTNGTPIPYTYASIYANGTSATLQNATSGASLLNPAWVQLDPNGKFQLQLGSTTSSGETFVLYVAVGTVVQQKTITQAAQQ